MGSLIQRLEESSKLINELEIHSVDLSNIEDGTYTGRHEIFPVSVEVKVIIRDEKITYIKLIKHSNGRGSSAEGIINRVIEEQSLEVDIITGATHSSMVILKAIEDALS